MRAQLIVAILIACSVVLPSSHAALVTPGAPTTTIPADLIDPLGTLSSPLPLGEFLLPIEISGAIGLQDWSFKLKFDSAVANPADSGGLYQSVEHGVFSSTDQVASDILSSGFPLSPGSLAGIAGFSSGVTGDGLLAFILFAFEPGQNGNDPNFTIDQVTLQQSVPEPGTAVLIATAILVIASRQARRQLSRRS
jgi:hypothetical protein